MKKGVLEMCVLYLLSREELYGYELMKRMETHFPDVDESTFYAILRRLNKSGCTESYQKAESGGPPRKYYRLTGEGRAALRRSVADWDSLTSTVRALGL